MIDIVTVVFQEELPILRLQAESIDLYCNNMNLGNIYVIVNDDNLDVSKIDYGWWGKFSNQVVVMHRRDWCIEYPDNGWLTQQLLKLLGAANSRNIWTMILDAKTIIIQPVNLDKIFDDTGRLTWGFMPIFPVFDTAKQRVGQLFNINQTHIAGPAGVPFFFHNQTVKDMIANLQQKTDQSFSKWFLDQGMITEFILYSGYIQYRDGSLDTMYVNSKNAYSLCNVCHSEVELFDQKYRQMQNPNTLTVSVHRNAWSQLTQNQRKQYQEFLLSKGITCAKDFV